MVAGESFRTEGGLSEPEPSERRLWAGLQPPTGRGKLPIESAKFGVAKSDFVPEFVYLY